VIEGSWLVEIIDHDTYQLRIEICPNNVSDANNLLRIINKHVEKGTTIMTDCWRAYNCLTADGFNHLTVCHKYNFINPNTLANTQKIESNWRPLRNRLSSGGVSKENLAYHFCEYLWARHIKKNNLLKL
jgi:transposase-like protein